MSITIALFTLFMQNPAAVRLAPGVAGPSSPREFCAAFPSDVNAFGLSGLVCLRRHNCPHPYRLCARRLQRAGPNNPLEAGLRVEFNTGYARTMAAGSPWRFVGRVPQGMAYQPVNAVLAVESAIEDGALLGFYLPGEQSYSSLSTKISSSIGG